MSFKRTLAILLLFVIGLPLGSALLDLSIFDQQPNSEVVTATQVLFALKDRESREFKSLGERYATPELAASLAAGADLNVWRKDGTEYRLDVKSCLAGSEGWDIDLRDTSEAAGSKRLRAVVTFARGNCIAVQGPKGSQQSGTLVIPMINVGGGWLLERSPEAVLGEK